jgi:hypothetical protein
MVVSVRQPAKDKNPPRLICAVSIVKKRASPVERMSPAAQARSLSRLTNDYPSGYVRFGSLADICSAKRHVRIAPIATAKADITRNSRTSGVEISQVLLGRKRERSTKIAPSAVNSKQARHSERRKIVRRQKAAIRNISKSPLLVSSQSCEAPATQLPGITRAVLRSPL